MVDNWAGESDQQRNSGGSPQMVLGRISPCMDTTILVFLLAVLAIWTTLSIIMKFIMLLLLMTLSCFWWMTTTIDCYHNLLDMATLYNLYLNDHPI